MEPKVDSACNKNTKGAKLTQWGLKCAEISAISWANSVKIFGKIFDSVQDFKMSMQFASPKQAAKSAS